MYCPGSVPGGKANCAASAERAYTHGMENMCTPRIHGQFVLLYQTRRWPHPRVPQCLASVYPRYVQRLRPHGRADHVGGRPNCSCGT